MADRPVGSPATSAIADCPHGDDPLLCPPCVRDRTGEHRTTVWVTAARFDARYSMTCPSCGDYVEVGEPIAMQERTHRGEDVRRYVCAGCG